MAYSHMVAGPAVQSASYAEAPPDAWEKALALIGFLVLLGMFRSVLFAGSTERTDGSALFQLVTSAIYMSGMVVLVARRIPSWALMVLMRSWPLVLLVLLALISAAWSQSPDASLRRAIALLLSSSFAFYLMVRFDLRTILNILAVAFGIFAAASIVAAMIPGVGLTPGGRYAGAMRGLVGQKNVFGRSIALGVILLPAAAFLRMVDHRKAVLAVGVVAFALLILSQSATALVAALAGIAIGTAVYLGLGGQIYGVRLRPEVGVTTLVVSAIIITLVVTYGWTIILEALGRDPTLTGRTKLWTWAMGINSDRQWLGSGFRAFWTSNNTKYFFEVFAWNSNPDGTRSESFAGPDHSHSGYVDTYLELGRVGLIAFAGMVLSAVVVLRRAFHQGHEKLGFIFAVILSFLLVYATTERSILQHSEDLWFLVTLFYLLTVKETFLTEREFQNSRLQQICWR